MPQSRTEAALRHQSQQLQASNDSSIKLFRQLHVSAPTVSVWISVDEASCGLGLAVSITDKPRVACKEQRRSRRLRPTSSPHRIACDRALNHAGHDRDCQHVGAWTRTGCGGRKRVGRGAHSLLPLSTRRAGASLPQVDADAYTAAVEARAKRGRGTERMAAAYTHTPFR